MHLKVRTQLLVEAVALLACHGMGLAIGNAGDTAWPKGAAIAVELKLSPAKGKDGEARMTGDLVVTNPTKETLTIQKPTNRLAMAFLVFNAMGNPVAPDGIGKSDPFFETVSLAPGATMTHHFENLQFVTGSALLEYKLKAGERYRVVVIYRPSGPRGPGYASSEVEIELPR